MHELFLPIAVMVFTLLVMGGLVKIFASWMVERDRLLDKAGGGSPSPTPAE